MPTPESAVARSHQMDSNNRASSESNWPTAKALQAELAPWRNKTAYIVPIADEFGKTLGNNGDELMMRVFWRILDEAGIRAVDDIRRADVLFVPPNGALLQMYAFPDLMRKYMSENMEAPTVIFPSSANFPTRDPAFLFRERTSKTTWILREKYSYDHLRNEWGESLASVGCELVLDHDVVASHSDVVREMFKSVRRDRPLVGARKDVERNSGSYELNHRLSSGAFGIARSAALRQISTRVPYGPVYTQLARAVRAKKQKEAGATLISRMPEISRKPFLGRGVLHRDISSKHQATFDEYLSVIAGAGPVLTDRLHIALPAAILGKDVWLVEGGYHKARGVVERSLLSVDNLHLLASPVEGK
ncbi:polysaccharide pyruvyl transferase family protein [Kocuria rosea]|uniref:polysaccharide pyruvyl transferase family protein n=1 Tax=Kocuria rosea TaxID=1275 RepID=UPI00232B2AEA|nr:polysaccharide pyruvyl transferase family protein [Kocuria rosea]